MITNLQFDHRHFDLFVAAPHERHLRHINQQRRQRAPRTSNGDLFQHAAAQQHHGHDRARMEFTHGKRGENRQRHQDFDADAALAQALHATPQNRQAAHGRGGEVKPSTHAETRPSERPACRQEHEATERRERLRGQEHVAIGVPPRFMQVRCRTACRMRISGVHRSYFR